MAGQRHDCVETLCLGQLSNLEQLEGPWLALIATGEPSTAAAAVKELRDAGSGYGTIATKLGITSSKVRRILAEVSQ